MKVSRPPFMQRSQPGGARGSLTISKCWAAFYLQRSLKKESAAQIPQTSEQKSMCENQIYSEDVEL